MKLGSIQLANFQPLTNAPQEAASAIGALPALVGSTITPILYVGEQIVDDGVNYWFISEETLITIDGSRRLIMFAINELLEDDEPTYELLTESITVLT